MTKEFIWGGSDKIARIKWVVMTKHTDTGGTWFKDHMITLDAAKNNMSIELIPIDRQPWMLWIEKELIQTETK